MLRILEKLPPVSHTDTFSHICSEPVFSGFDYYNNHHGFPLFCCSLDMSAATNHAINPFICCFHAPFVHQKRLFSFRLVSSALVRGNNPTSIALFCCTPKLSDNKSDRFRGFCCHCRLGVAIAGLKTSLPPRVCHCRPGDMSLPRVAKRPEQP